MLNKRGLENVILMAGVIIAMAVVLMSGFFLIANFIQAQATADSRYLTTELVSIVNTLQSGPEEVQFNYFTETDENSYPVIGSLEIDDDSNELCIHPKTEDEIFGTIAEKASIAAGFGAAGYANARIRGAVAQRATQAAVRDDVFFTNRYVVPYGPDIAGQQAQADLLSDANTPGGRQLRYDLGKKTPEGYALKKYAGGGRLDKKERVLFAKWAKNPKNADAWKELRSKRAIMVDALSKGNPRAQELSKYYARGRGMSFINKIKHPFRFRELSKAGAKLDGHLVRTGDAKLFTKIKDKITIKNVGKGVTQGKIMGGVVAAQYLLSGGDWVGASTTAVQLAIANYAPKVVSTILVKTIPKAATQLITQVGGNIAIVTAEEVEGGIPAYGQVAFGVKKAAEILVNIGFSTYYLIQLDLTLFQIFDASANAVIDERNLKACQNFNNYHSEKVLLGPPNCVPEVQFGPSIEQNQLLYSAGFLTASGTFGFSMTYALATAFFPSLGGAKLAVGLIPFGIGVGTFVASTAALSANIAQNPGDFVPRSGCFQSCDRDYTRQDCPNWFISDPGGGSQIAGGAHIIGGCLWEKPAC